MRFFQLTVTTDERLLVTEEPIRKSKKKKKKNAITFSFDDHVKKYSEFVRITDEAIAEEEFGRDIFINFSFIDEKKAVLIMATERDGDTMQVIRDRFCDYLSKQEYEGDAGSCEEITGSNYRALLKTAHNKDFIKSYDATVKQYGFFKYINSGYYHDFSFDEFIIEDESVNREEALRQVSEMQAVPSLGEEIERIFLSKRRCWKSGNPVHYVLAADEGKYRNEYFMLLMKSLYSCKRLLCRRFTQIDYEDLCDGYDRNRLNELYKLQRGGVIVFSIKKETLQNSSYLKGGESRAEQLCKMAAKWKNETLTIFLFPRDSEKLQDAFFLELDGVSLIKVEETIVFDKAAKTFLRNYAREKGLRAFPGLCDNIEKGAGYSKTDLEKIFSSWYNIFLREKVFPQYATNAIVMNKATNKADGTGVKRLNELIGLSETKTLIKEILDFAKAQKLYSFDEIRQKQALHMIFSGNPGTAKTTVARLVAQILKENEILECGDLFEVGRGDLVDMYLGGTAPRVKRAFKRARGSVLFIDEAYSLVDGDEGLYGDEAISTIVQEMENYRDEVVVIFAGYPDKMEGFLQKNPGLRSRIGFHVSFPDYSPDELYEILELLAKDNKMKLSENVRERVYPIIEKASGTKGFGNGRYTRNMLEKARMKQATRLMRMEPAKVTEQVATTLIAEDFEEIRLTVLPAEKRVGFN